MINKIYWLEMWKFVMCDKKSFFYCGNCEECIYSYDSNVVESDISELEKLGFTNNDTTIMKQIDNDAKIYFATHNMNKESIF